MQEAGLEPAQYCYHRHLKPARLPIPPFLRGKYVVLILMQEAGLEPAQYCYHRHLKPARLPIPPFLHITKYFLSCSATRDNIPDFRRKVKTYLKKSYICIFKKVLFRPRKLLFSFPFYNLQTPSFYNSQYPFL
jgi:hypothetical protein